MSVHDWTRVDAGVFHHFHHSWIEEIKRVLNGQLLSENHYAMIEQLTVRGRSKRASPSVPITAMEFYRRKQNAVAVRHVSGDRVVAMVEVVSPGNKSSRNALRSFVEKAAELLNERIHLLILDVHPPGPRDPAGIHGAIWEEIAGHEYDAPPDRPLTFAAYETELTVRAYVEHLAVGQQLVSMPLFLEPGGQVPVPLEQTYQAAFAAMPRRWQTVLESPREAT
jgi:hypothetical protein